MKETAKIQQRIFTGLKVFLPVLIFSILLFKFSDYLSLKAFFKSIDFTNSYLILLLFLFPLNIFFEVIKWRIVLKELQNISWKKAIISIFAGYAVGFVMPNKMGSFIGRVVYLEPGKRIEGGLKSIYNNFAQLLITLLAGIFVLNLFFVTNNVNVFLTYVFILLYCIILVLLHILYFNPNIFSHFAKFIFNKKIIRSFISLKQLKSNTKRMIYFYSLIRYSIFTFQFILSLYLFGVELEVVEAVQAVVLIFWLTSLFPIFLFGKLFIRESVALFVMSIWWVDEQMVFNASLLIWFVNLFLPAFLGALFLFFHKLKIKGL